jgi:hypothetical protein
MICAEDEIGVSDDHAGIIVLSSDIAVGSSVADIYEYYEDWIYEIGLTPNRMDAMSHFGVAKDVCAYLSYHESPVQAKSPLHITLQKDNTIVPTEVTWKINNGVQPTYKVKSKHIEIVGTATHPLLVNRDGIIQYVDIQDLKPKKDKLINIHP